MTVQAATKMWSRDGGSIATSDGIQRSASVKEGYQVVCDPDDRIEDILDAPDLPRLGDLYGSTQAIYCKAKTPQRIGPVLWMVQVDWAGEFGPNGADTHPVNQPPQINWSDVETEEAVDEDFDGNPIVTANNEPISGVTVPLADQILTVRRNFYSINTYAIRQYRRAVNSDNFEGWPPGTVRFVGYNADRQFFRDTEEYWAVTAKFQFREPYNTTPDKTWHARVRHEGFYVRSATGASGKIVRATDETKEPTTKPVLLKADGTRETDPDSAVWLEFKRFGTLPFTALGMTD